MEASSKDAEVRARVPEDLHTALSKIAKARGEQMPVIVREALTEYLAKRAATSTSKYPEPGTESLLQILRDQPDVAQTLLALGRLLKPTTAKPNSNPLSRVEAAEQKILSAALADAHGASGAHTPPGKPVKYKLPRPSKTKPKP